MPYICKFRWIFWPSSAILEYIQPSSRDRYNDKTLMAEKLYKNPYHIKMERDTNSILKVTWLQNTPGSELNVSNTCIHQSAKKILFETRKRYKFDFWSCNYVNFLFKVLSWWLGFENFECIWCFNWAPNQQFIELHIFPWGQRMILNLQ